jgi:hypothetical protein
MDNPFWTTAAAAQSNAPVVAFVAGSLLLGGLINTYPPGGPEQVTSLQVCPPRSNNATAETGLLPKPAVAALTLLLPLLAMSDSPSRKLFVSHAVGQAGSFSTSELARYLIVQPNAQFFQDCRLSPETCLATAVLQPLVAKDGICDNTTASDYDALRENLHGFPDVTSSLVGAAAVSFFLALAARRRKKYAVAAPRDVEKEEVESVIQGACAAAKPHLKFFSVFATFGVVCVLLVDRYTQSVNTLFEMLVSTILGACFQLAVFYFVMGHQ